ncbi:DUF6343 family protein [Streptomyces zagrosensis]|uniref:Uncharacterized protein n=1 Tax=Streptomyces zagrosensis TaxID=1042984 RepID=A0A7W9UWA7_9ACTN|nr:DUF6343 family protein [Streptomyces zagrosensis]MBB5933588.1 hypothetical protein [Streptomyces zagrosensis]
MLRTGDEPLHARSPLRLRLGLALWGLAWSIAGAVAFAVVSRPGWAAACAVIVVVTATDLVFVIRRLRQGAHYQPGREVPPYEPSNGDASGPAPVHGNGGGRQDRRRSRAP